MEFRPMRRIRQELPTEKCIRTLEKATAGVLALVGDNGYPYGVPLSYVYHDGAIYFHSAIAGHKIDAIQSEERCSFTVIEKDEVHPDKYTTYFRSVIVFGRIHIIEDEEGKMSALRLLGERYNPGHPTATDNEIGKHMSPENHLQHIVLLRLDIEHLTGKEAIELVKMRE